MDVTFTGFQSLDRICILNYLLLCLLFFSANDFGTNDLPVRLETLLHQGKLTRMHLFYLHYLPESRPYIYP